MKTKSSNNLTERPYQYQEQQHFLNELASKLHVVAFRPEYHGKENDANTVLFYLKADAEHNEMVDKQDTQYSRTFAQLYHIQDERYIYRDHFWSFQNTDCNGRLDYGYANNGSLQLSTTKLKERLEGALRLALARKKQNEYTAASGGCCGLLEADDTNNDLNLEIIQAYKMCHEHCFIGMVNICDPKKREALQRDAGKADVLEEYVGQPVYNFCCDFIIPERDEKLEKMIVEWNRPGTTGLRVQIDQIMDRITTLHGIHFLWV